MILATSGLFVLTLFVAGCSDSAEITGISGTRLTPGTTYSADLDGDGVLEQIVVDGASASLSILDDDSAYTSRSKWRVVDACLGDTDHNGLLEVVTLLDSDEGRHLGLFAYFGGEYRERLVTSELYPRPLALEVVASDEDPVNAGGPTTAGDLILMTVEPAPGETGEQTVRCRWNGFGFTGLEAPLSD